MKKILAVILCVFFLYLSVLPSGAADAFYAEPEPPVLLTVGTDVSLNVKAKAYALMDVNTGTLLAAYNDAKIGGAWQLSSLNSLPEDKRPAACIGCGACTGHCPQTLKIPDYMREMAEMMR